MAVVSKDVEMNLDVQALREQAMELRGAYMAKIVGRGFAGLKWLVAPVWRAIFGEVRQWRSHGSVGAELTTLDPRILREMGVEHSGNAKVANTSYARHPEQVPFNHAA